MSEDNKTNEIEEPTHPMETMRAIWDKRDLLSLNGAQTAVLIQFVGCSGKGGEYPYPSVRSLVQTTGFHRSTVQRCLKSLLSKQLLLKVGESSPHEHLPTAYEINQVALCATENKETSK